MTAIFGFGNKARHGKDTAGESVVAHYGERQRDLYKLYGSAFKPFDVRLYKFADELYRECRELHGMTEKDAPLLQRVGMARREEDKDYWVNKTFAKITAERPDIAVITDTRFPNEADAIVNAGGVTVNVTRLNLDGTPYVADDRPADHPSETALDNYPWDYYIKAYSGEVALVEQLAITIVEFARARRP